MTSKVRLITVIYRGSVLNTCKDPGWLTGILAEGLNPKDTMTLDFFGAEMIPENFRVTSSISRNISSFSATYMHWNCQIFDKKNAREPISIINPWYLWETSGQKHVTRIAKSFVLWMVAIFCIRHRMGSLGILCREWNKSDRRFCKTEGEGPDEGWFCSCAATQYEPLTWMKRQFLGQENGGHGDDGFVLSLLLKSPGVPKTIFYCKWAPKRPLFY